MTGHQYNDALVAEPDGFGHWESGSIDVSGFTDPETNPDPVNLTLAGYKALWVSYVPATSATGVLFDVTRLNTPGFALVYLYKVETGGSYSVVDSEMGDGVAEIIADVTAGTQYYLRFAAADSAETGMYVVLNGAPAALGDGVLVGPPISVDAGFKADPDVYYEHPAQTDADPFVIAVAVAPTVGDPVQEQLDVPAIPVQAAFATNVRVVDAGIDLIQPADEEVVVTDEPEFVVAVTQHDDTLIYTVEIQYTDDPAFLTNVETLSLDAADGASRFILTQAVPTPTVYWRARLLLSGVEQVPWSPSQTFTVAPVLDFDLPVTWTIDGGADRPIHLWHFSPEGSHAGDTVVAYGQGFPSTGTISVNEVDIPVVSWQLVNASAQMSSPDRVISGSVVDPEHYEITFVAPEIEPPGGPFVVEA